MRSNEEWPLWTPSHVPSASFYSQGYGCRCSYPLSLPAPLSHDLLGTSQRQRTLCEHCLNGSSPYMLPPRNMPRPGPTLPPARLPWRPSPLPPRMPPVRVASSAIKMQGPPRYEPDYRMLSPAPPPFVPSACHCNKLLFRSPSYNAMIERPPQVPLPSHRHILSGEASMWLGKNHRKPHEEVDERSRWSAGSNDSVAAAHVTSPSSDNEEELLGPASLSATQLGNILKRSLTRYDLSLFHEAVVDCYARFLLNLPAHLLEDSVHLRFQMEEAQWWYSDFWLDSHPTALPTLNLRTFSELVCRCFSSLRAYTPEFTNNDAWEKWTTYCRTIPLRGAIILDQRLENALLGKSCSNRIFVLHLHAFSLHSLQNHTLVGTCTHEVATPYWCIHLLTLTCCSGGLPRFHVDFPPRQS